LSAIIFIFDIACSCYSAIPLKLAGRSLRSVGADIIYGLVDGSILGAFAIAGATFAGTISAVFGGAAGNALSDGFGGLWELLKIKKHLRQKLSL
jgi:hypothetical protein